MSFTTSSSGKSVVANPNVTVNVNGYCDAIGGEEDNLKLSDRTEKGKRQGGPEKGGKPDRPSAL